MTLTATRVATDTLLTGPVTLSPSGPADSVTASVRESYDDHVLRFGPRPDVSAALLADVEHAGLQRRPGGDRSGVRGRRTTPARSRSRCPRGRTG